MSSDRYPLSEAKLWTRRSLAFSLAIAAHGLLAYALTGSTPPPPKTPEPKPMEISIAMALPMVAEPEPTPPPPPPPQEIPPAPPEPVVEPVVEVPPPVIKKPEPPRNPKPIKKPKPPKPKPVVQPQPQPVAEPVKQDLPPAPPSPPAPPAKKVTAKPAEVGPKRQEVNVNTAYQTNPAPPYPPMSKRLAEEGTVYLRVLINAQGLVEQIEVKTSSGKARLDEAALKAVKRWKFQPAKENGQAITSYATVPIKFSLSE